MDYIIGIIIQFVLMIYKLTHKALAVGYATFKGKVCPHMWGFLQISGTRKVCPICSNIL